MSPLRKLAPPFVISVVLDQNWIIRFFRYVCDRNFRHCDTSQSSYRNIALWRVCYKFQCIIVLRSLLFILFFLILNILTVKRIKILLKNNYDVIKIEFIEYREINWEVRFFNRIFPLSTIITCIYIFKNNVLCGYLLCIKRDVLRSRCALRVLSSIWRS